MARNASATRNSVQAYLKEIGRISRLTREEEVSLGKQVQRLMKVEKVRDELAESLDRDPTLEEWAEAAGIDLPDLKRRIGQGKRAKLRMVEANLRLVVSIAKKIYQAQHGFDGPGAGGHHWPAAGSGEILTPPKAIVSQPTPTGGFARPSLAPSLKKKPHHSAPHPHL